MVAPVAGAASKPRTTKAASHVVRQVS